MKRLSNLAPSPQSGPGKDAGGGEVWAGGVRQKHNLPKVAGDGVPVVAQWLTNWTRNHEVAGSIPGLA